MQETKSTQDALITKMEKTLNVPRKVSIFSRNRDCFYKNDTELRGPL